MGTPNEVLWPGISQLQDFNPQFPNWPTRPLSGIVPTLDAEGTDLLQRMLVYHPAARITAQQALQHPYFFDVPAILQELPTIIPMGVN